MIKLIAELAGGGSAVFANPIAFELNKTYGTPCHQLVITFQLTAEVGEITNVTLYHDADKLFYGITDRQVQAISAGGALLTLECRSPAALLVDNEAVPRVQYYAYLSGIVKVHAAKFGIKGVRGGDPYLSQYTVFKGFSVWHAIDLFCRQTIGYSPAVTGDGYIDVTPPGGGRTVAISNLAKNAYCYTHLTKEINRCNVISGIKIYNQYNGYGTVVENKAAAGVQRTRLLIPSNEWANLPKKSAEEAIKGSMLEKTRWVVTIPDIIRCDIGDHATVYDKPFDEAGLFIGGITYTCAELLTTTLTLYDSRYI